MKKLFFAIAISSALVSCKKETSTSTTNSATIDTTKTTDQPKTGYGLTRPKKSLQI